MTKNEYLRLLKNNLQDILKISSQEAMMIVDDYNEYFESGISDGKSEQELCIEFGDPAVIAKELSDSISIKKVFINKKIFYYIMFIFVFILSLIAGVAFSNILLAGILITIFIPVLLFAFYKYTNISIVLIKSKKYRLLSILAFSPLIIGLLKWFIDSGWYIWANLTLDGFNLDNIIPEKMGISTEGNLYLLYLFGLSGLFLTFLCACKKDLSKCFPIMFLFSGAMQASLCMRSLFHSLTSVDELNSKFVFTLFPLLIGILLCAFLVLILIRKTKKEVN